MGAGEPQVLRESPVDGSAGVAREGGGRTGWSRESIRSGTGADKS